MRKRKAPTAQISTDRAEAIARFLLSREVKRLGGAAAVQRVIDERWPSLTDDEMERAIFFVAHPQILRSRQ